ncbi:DMT family transporter [Alteromonas sp. 5E99-2]|uniref:DMT family transporter n=1 Tax=Alteromonas sp. 5E99-2 TaxID=2817683 RepID=UPI001A988A47|nr:DMT family transporter [Alteromonas sp. 5E99-2]MBO1255911.1 DMT family transporter [Alteromonas sp. 5E99-2]
MSWIFFTLGAVVMQTLRNALQSQLSNNVSTAGVTLARFLFAPPIALVYLLALNWFSPLEIPHFSLLFIITVSAAALLQISATALMVLLFKQKNFSVGAGLAKSEALVAGVLGTLFFGSQMNLFGWLGILIGGLAVFILSGGGKNGTLSLKTVIIGLACGSCFALTSLFVREASLMLSVPFPHSAAWVLLWVLCIQTVLLSIYIFITDKSTYVALKSNSRTTILTSVTSCFGSICWFSAMALQHVAYVKTLGQLEVVFTIVLATFWLKQSVKKHEIIGLFLIAGAAILVMLA